MAPEFALFLSPDGIALAHRQPAGHWAVLADTALDVDDLSVALTDIRKQAEDRAGDSFATLVVLPDDQVLFTSLTAPGPDEEDRLEQIRDGLNGLTPYPVEDLAFDYVPLEDGRVKLAVVARETLAEAESFAKEHGFDPAGFAARPLDNRFPGVAHFDRDPDWTAAISDIEFGHDSWPKSNAKPEEAESEPEKQADAEGAPEAEQSLPDAAEDATADTAGDGPKKSAEPAIADEGDRAEETGTTGDDDPDEDAAEADPATAEETDSEDAKPDPEPALEAGAADEDAADEDGESPPEKTGLAPDTTPVEAAALSVPKGFGVRRDREVTPDALAERIGSRPSRLGIAGGADGAPTPPDLARKPAESDEAESPRFGRGRTATPGDETTGEPERPFAAGPAPELPPLTRTKLQAKRNSTSLTPPEQPARPAPPPLSTDPTPAKDAKPSRRGRLSGMGKRISASAEKARDTASGLTAKRKAPERAEPGDAAPVPTPVGSIRSRLKTLGRRSGKTADGPAEQPSVGSEPPAPAADIAPPPARTRRDFGGKGRHQSVTAATPPVTDADASLTGGLLARGRAAKSNGPSLRTGLILTLILLAVLGLIAIWAVFYLPDTALARWMGMGREDPAIIVTDSGPEITAPPDLPAGEDTSQSVVGLAPEASAPQAPSLTPQAPELLPDIDADLDLDPVAPPRVDPETLLPTREENEAFYARTGVWQRPPVIDLPMPETALDDVLLASLDPPVASHDAIALPAPTFNISADLPRRQSIPVDPNTEFVFGDDGLVVPAPDGALNPDGILIYAGTPDVLPRPRPDDNPAALAAAEAEADATGAAIQAEVTAGAIDTAVLAALRPDQRPTDLQEQRERYLLGGISYSELARIRPDTRPASIQELAAAEVAESEAEAVAAGADPAEITTDSPMAVAISFVPPTRPANIGALVEAARASGESGPAPAVAADRSDTVQPSIPSSASVTRAATQENAINLRRINLIGVTGSPSDRRALVRLPSGRFVTVERGDRLDGGQVAAISENALQYVKRGQTITLQMPAG